MDRIRRDRARLELARVVAHYTRSNDRFESWLDQRDAARRERTRARLASVDGRGQDSGVFSYELVRQALAGRR